MFFAGLGFILLPGAGEFWGILIALLLSLFVFTLGDKIILGVSNAKTTIRDEFVISMVNNYSCRLGVGNIGIYSSIKFPNNIYFVETVFSRPSLMIGDNVTKYLTKEEVRALIFSSLLRIKKGDALYRTVTSLFLVPFLAPVFFSYMLKKIRIKISTSYIGFLTLPMKMINNKLLKNPREIMNFDKEVTSQLNESSNLASAIFKISAVNLAHEGVFSASIVESLSIADNKSIGIISNIEDLNLFNQERYQALKN